MDPHDPPQDDVNDPQQQDLNNLHNEHLNDQLGNYVVIRGREPGLYYLRYFYPSQMHYVIHFNSSSYEEAKGPSPNAQGVALATWRQAQILWATAFLHGNTDTIEDPYVTNGHFTSTVVTVTQLLTTTTLVSMALAATTMAIAVMGE